MKKYSTQKEVGKSGLKKNKKKIKINKKNIKISIILIILNNKKNIKGNTLYVVVVIMDIFMKFPKKIIWN